MYSSSWWKRTSGPICWWSNPNTALRSLAVTAHTCPSSISWMEGYGLRPRKREHPLPWCPGTCVEYICGEKGGNADLTCVLLTSEVQILTVGLYIHYENSNGKKKKKKENWYLFKDLNPAWSIPLQCIAGKCQLKYLLGNAMYWDPFFSSRHPQYNLREILYTRQQDQPHLFPFSSVTLESISPRNLLKQPRTASKKSSENKVFYCRVNSTQQLQTSALLFSHELKKQSETKTKPQKMHKQNKFKKQNTNLQAPQTSSC